MVFKKIATVCIVAAATFAAAQTGPLFGAHGRGVAQNADGARAQFSFQAVKPANNADGFRGSLNMTIPNRDRHIVHEFVLPGIHRLAVDGNVAEFGGRGGMIVRTRDRVSRVEGMIAVRVEDLRAPNSNEGRDRISLVFTPRNGDPRTFAGLVVDGQIAVFDRR